MVIGASTETLSRGGQGLQRANPPTTKVALWGIILRIEGFVAARAGSHFESVETFNGFRKAPAQYLHNNEVFTTTIELTKRPS